RAGVEDDAPKPTLEHWSLADRRLTVLAEGVTDLAASGDGETLVITQGEQRVQVPAARKVEDEDPARIVIDTSRMRLTVDPVKERRGMLWDNYRIMAQQYWRADMDGMDWYAMTSWYDPVIERLVTDDDFQDMMWGVQGELGTSHAYVQGKVYKADPPMLPAYLGADFELRDGRWVITRILPGDSSDPDARSPLLAPGVGAQVGGAVRRVDGPPVLPPDRRAACELRHGRRATTRLLPGGSSDPHARSPLLAPGVGAQVGDALLRVDGRPVHREGVEAALLGAADKPTELVLLRD